MATADDAWWATLHAAQVTTGDGSLFTAPGAQQQDDGWRVSLPEHTRVDFGSDANDHFDRLVRAWSADEDGLVLRDRMGEEQILREVVHRAGRVAAETRLYGTTVPDWPAIFAEVTRALSIAVAAVPLGGVFSSEVDELGYATPIPIGTRAIAGHLDSSFEEAVQAMARSAGLPGFRFTDESWWTQEFMGAIENDEVDQDGSRPWLVAAWILPAAGDAAEHAAIIASEALLGTLVLLDHTPGTYWDCFTPWIPGCPSRAGNPCLSDVADSDNTVDTDVQQVDGSLERLDGATTTGAITIPHEIDLGAHAVGPASALLRAVAYASSSEPAADAEHAWKLASSARLAFTASTATASDVRIALANKAIELLTGAAGASESNYVRLSQAGYRWRVERDAQWPPCGLLLTTPLDQERWLHRLPAYDQLRAGQGSTSNLPAWAIKEVENAELAMNALQATFFGIAADLSGDPG